MKKVIIFGATGRLGVYLVDYLKDFLPTDEYKIIAIGRKETDFFKKMGVDYYQLDITNKQEFNILPNSDVYVVVNLAAILASKMDEYNPYKYIDINITGTLNILEYCKRIGIEKIIYPQTIKDIEGHFGTKIPLNPYIERKYKYSGDDALYTISKNTAVDLIEKYHTDYKLKRFILRLPTIYLYSPNPYYYVNGQKRMLAYRFLIDQAIKGETINLWGDPDAAHDVVYVKDFCQMVYKAILANNDGGIYNVGTANPISMQEQIEGIIEVFSSKNNKSRIIYLPDKPSCRQYSLDIQNARDELGYIPQYSYLEYLEDFKKEMELNRFREIL